MRALQRAEGGGRDVFMPFVYPPVFGLVLAPLALLPVAPAFLLFAGGTLALYLAVLRWLSGPWFALAALVSTPAMVIDLRLGQNGLLTGGLAGLAVGLSLRGRGGLAGAAAGLLAFKPQIATGLALDFLLRRDGRALATGAAMAAAAAAIALGSLGLDTVAPFWDAVTSMGRLMTAGIFPLHRMVSAYASAASFGLSAPAAMLLHGVAALAVLATVGVTTWRHADRRATAGFCLMSTAFVSPYLFDYDLPVFCVGLTLALPALAAVLRPRQLGTLLAAVALGESIGLMLNALDGRVAGPLPSLSFPILVACFGATGAALRRGRRRAGPRSTVVPRAAVPSP